MGKENSRHSSTLPDAKRSRDSATTECSSKSSSRILATSKFKFSETTTEMLFICTSEIAPSKEDIKKFWKKHQHQEFRGTRDELLAKPLSAPPRLSTILALEQSSLSWTNTRTSTLWK